MTDAAAERNISWYRQPLVWLVIAIPASSVIMGITMIVISVQSFDGMVADDYYRRGLEINRDLSRDDTAMKRGLQAEIIMDPPTGTLRARVTSAADTGALPARLMLLLVHPTRAGMDRSLALESIEPGVYRGRLAPLAPGKWHVMLEAENWRLVGRMPVPGTGLVDLTPGG